MKAIIFLLVFGFLLCTNHIYAQDRCYFAIASGGTVPFKNSFNKENNNFAGIAGVGALYDLSFVYKLGENSSLIAQYRFQYYEFVESGLIPELKDQFPDYNFRTLYFVNMWKTTTFMLGAYRSFPITERTSFDTRAMMGFTNVVSPEFTIRGEGIYPESVSITQDEADAISTSLLLGAGIKFGKHIYGLVNLDYMYVNPTFRSVWITNYQFQSGSYNTSETRHRFSQKLKTLNLSIGLGLR